MLFTVQLLKVAVLLQAASSRSRPYWVSRDNIPKHAHTPNWECSAWARMLVIRYVVAGPIWLAHRRTRSGDQPGATLLESLGACFFLEVLLPAACVNRACEAICFA